MKASSFDARFGKKRGKKKRPTTNKTAFLFRSLLLVNMLWVWDFWICFETAVVTRVLFSVLTVATCCYRKRTSLNCSMLSGFCFRCQAIFHIWIQLMIFFDFFLMKCIGFHWRKIISWRYRYVLYDLICLKTTRSSSTSPFIYFVSFKCLFCHPYKNWTLL